MFSTISNILKVADLRSKILFTLGILIVFRIGSFIPVPSVNTDVFIGRPNTRWRYFRLDEHLLRGRAVQLFDLCHEYIPVYYGLYHCAAAQHGCHSEVCTVGKRRRGWTRKLAQITRYGTIVLGLIQAFGMSIGFHRQYMRMVTDPTAATFTIIAIVLTAGTALLMWLGEQITERGIGNGISIIIFAGIVAAIPTGITALYQHFFTGAGAAEGMFLNILIRFAAGSRHRIAYRSSCLCPARGTQDSGTICEAYCRS